MATPKILIAATSCDQLGETGKKTGAWLEEIAAPFNAFKAAGFGVVIATPKGIRPPIDDGSRGDAAMTADCKAFEQDADAQRAMDGTVKIAGVNAGDFAAVFVPGGHGVCWDLATDADLGALLAAFNAAGKPVSAVCHGPVALGAPGADTVLANRTAVTGFSNEEEKMVQLHEVVPYSLEDMLNAKSGGKYEKGAAAWGVHVCVSGNLVTGQNPASSAATATAVLKLLKKEE